MTASFADIAGYVAAVRQIPLLAPEEETALAAAWRDGDREAGRRLVESHLRLAVRMAYQLRGYGLPLADLIAEGNVGLMQALERFDPDRGLRFATYAIWWIKAAMLEHVMQQAAPVRMSLSAERKKVFFKLRSLTNRINGGQRLAESEVSEVAERLGVRAQTVREMEQFLSANHRSLDAPRPGEGEGTWLDLLADDRPDPETEVAERQEHAHRRRLLAEAWKGLTEREQDIVTERCLREKPKRLEDLAQRYGISRERVRQIEAAAMRKLRRLIGLDAKGPLAAAG